MRLVFLLALTLFSATTFAKNDCEANILTHRQRMVFQMRNALETKPSSIVIRGQRYMLIRQLGRSRSTAHLAMSPEGQIVLVKDYDLPTHGIDSPQSHLFFREFIVTKFLRNHRIPVPRILDYDLELGVVVKEYVEGLLEWEYRSRARQSFGVAADEFTSTYADLRVQEVKIKALSPAFSNWIDANTASALPRGTPTSITSAHILPRHIDARDDNFVYNFEREKWILFDP